MLPTHTTAPWRHEQKERPMWDDRYASADYLFGTKPAAFLVSHAALLRPGQRALAIADGEGRNSIFLAEQGLSVTALDSSSVGVAKAQRLAAERQVSVDFRVADVFSWEWTPDTYDLVVAVFIQFLNPDERSQVFDGMQRTLRIGGRVLLHGYRPEQLDYGTGGPPFPEFMYTEVLLRTAFQEMSIEQLDTYDAELDEGAGHVGRSALIDLVARKQPERRSAERSATM
jgi:cyclopropane fatty-acyl-phospholipid synthase-like methyltransferase